MGKRCCIHKCVKRKEDQISVYRFPPADNPERERWIQAIPLSSLKGDITDESVVCSRHWPVGTPMISVFGKERPSCPPSIFGGKENKLPPLRTTVKSCAEARRPPPQSFADQQAVLKEKDSFTFQSLQTSLIEEKKTLPVPTTVFTVAGVLFIQSLEFICGIPNFLIKIFPSLKFETFHGGVKCFVSSLSANRMTKLDQIMKQYGTSNLRKIPVTKMLSTNKRKSCNLESSARLCTHRGCSSERSNTSVLQDVCTTGSGKTLNYRRFKPSLESHLVCQSSQKAPSYLAFSGT